MDRVSYARIVGYISSIRALGHGFITNFYHDVTMVELWQKYDSVWSIYVGDALLIIRKNNGFWNLFYCASTLERLEVTLDNFRIKYPYEILIVDIVGNEKSTAELSQLLTKYGYLAYSSLVRMSRIIMNKEQPQKGISYAEQGDVSQINALLHLYFDPFCEQLPMKEQLEQWIERKQLLVCREQNEITGFLIFDVTGLTSYLRYWFTHPDHRDKKIGSRLLRHFFFESNNTKRQFLWVIEDNENAIKRYHHYGFNEEKMYDKVLINKLV